MITDFEDESQIAKEQDMKATALSSDRFLKPIKELNLPKAIGLDKGTTIKEAVKLMQSKKIGSVVVLDKKNLVGIFTERDILMRVIGIIPDWENKPISSVMTEEPQCLMEKDEIAYILNNMHVGGYRHIPIINDKNEPLAMVSIKDMVNWILSHFPAEIMNLTGAPFRGSQNRDIGG